MDAEDRNAYLDGYGTCPGGDYAPRALGILLSAENSAYRIRNPNPNRGPTRMPIPK